MGRLDRMEELDEGKAGNEHRRTSTTRDGQKEVGT
jgi:hypothetical protein